MPRWRGDHVTVKQVVDDFARYLYPPRLQAPEVLHRAVADGAGLRTRSRFCEIPKKPRIRWENRGALRVRTGQKRPNRTRNGWQYGWQWAAKRNIHGRVLPSPRWPAVRRQPATIRRDRDEGIHQVPARVAGCFLRHPADCLFGGPALRAAAWCTANVVVLVRRVSVAELRALSPSTW